MVNQITLVIEVDDVYLLTDVVDKLKDSIVSIGGVITQVGIYKKRSNDKTSGGA